MCSYKCRDSRGFEKEQAACNVIGSQTHEARSNKRVRFDDTGRHADTRTLTGSLTHPLLLAEAGERSLWQEQCVLLRALLAARTSERDVQMLRDF